MENPEIVFWCEGCEGRRSVQIGDVSVDLLGREAGRDTAEDAESVLLHAECVECGAELTVKLEVTGS